MRLAVVLLVLAGVTVVHGAAIIGNGNVVIGVDDYGQLNAPGEDNIWFGSGAGGVGSVGLRDPSGIYHSTEAGCLCEGWGVDAVMDSGALVQGKANNAQGGATGLTLVGFTGATNGATATSVVQIAGYLQIEHDFFPAPASDALFQAHVTFTNINASETFSNVRYRRTMDWDIVPTTFDERVTIAGTQSTDLLIRSSNDGFCDNFPSSPCGPRSSYDTDTKDFEDFGGADHGASFDFQWGELAPGETIEFDIFYGAAQSEAEALSALGAIGAEVYSLGQNNNIDDISGEAGWLVGGPYTFMFAFRGVGGVAVVPPSVCIPVDEGCSVYSTCDRAAGEVNCTCLPGFEGDGVTCTDIDECQIEGEVAKCHHNADCENSPGSFSCVCGTGYVGDGFECSGDAWGVRTVFALDPSWTSRRSLTEEERDLLRLIYARLVSGDSALPQNSSLVSGMPVAFGWSHYGGSILDVTYEDSEGEMTLIALFSDQSDANNAVAILLSEDPTTYWSTIGTVLDPPQVYRWSLDPIQINPTGLTVDRVYFEPTCLSNGCWKVDVTYTVGIDNFNVFYLPKTDGDDGLSYDQSYDTVTAPWLISPEDTFLPSNHPCTSADYQASMDPLATPASVTMCCIPEFLAMYRPVDTFESAISSDLMTAITTNCGDGARSRDVTRSNIPIIAKRGQAVGSNVYARPIAPVIVNASGDIFQSEEHGIFAQGTFDELTSNIVPTGIVDAYVGIYEATLSLDEVELRKLAGQLTGTVGVEHTVDTFVGLAEFSPTGTFVVDPFVTQVNIHLEKTSFFSVSTHGTNDYTFLEYVNMRLVSIYLEDDNFSSEDESGDRTVRTDASDAAHYVQVTFTLGSQYEINESEDLIPRASVRAGRGQFFADAALDHKCMEWAGEGGYSFDDQATFTSRLGQTCAPNAAMCASPSSIPDSFVVFNLPLGIDFFGDASATLSNNVFVDMVISAVDTTASGVPNDGDDPMQMKTTLTASIPVVEGGVNIFCDGFTAKTDLKDVANADIVVGSASTAEELTRLRIKEDIASTQLAPDAITEINSDSIEAGLMTLVLKGNSSYFLSNSGRASVTVELEDVITLHIMEDDGSGADTDVSSSVSALITAAPDDNTLPSGLDTDGYALNDAFYFAIDRASQRAHLEPSEALLALCPLNPPRPDGSVGLETCVLRRDVRFRDYPWRVGGQSTAMEICTSGTPGVDIAPGSCPSVSSSGSDESKFFVTMFGDNDYAKDLAVDYATVIAAKYKLNGRYRRAYWINPGYEWTPTQTGGVPLFSVSQKLYLFALVTLDEGLTDDDGQGVPGVGPNVRRRMLLQSTNEEKLQDGQSSVGAEAFEFQTSPASMMAKAFEVPEDRVATFKVQLQITATEACMGNTELQASIRATLIDFLLGASSPLHTVQVTQMSVDRTGVQCTRRSVRAMLTSLSEATAEVTMLVVFKEGTEPTISLDRIATMSGVQAIEPLIVSPKVTTATDPSWVAPSPRDEDKDSSSSNLVVIVAAAVGGGVAVAICGAALLLLRRRQTPLRLRQTEEPVAVVQTIDVQDLKAQLSSEA